MPAAQIEIGEKKDEQRRSENGFSARAPDAISFIAQIKEFAPEAKVDADIGQHRPGKCGGCGKDHSALHHKDNGEEECEQARNADDEAFVERQARHFVFVGVRLPQIDLWQIGGAQFGDISDRGAGVERQTEDIGIRRIFALGREALARGNRRDARGAKIRPDHAGADKPEMRRDDQAFDLLIRVIGQREGNPEGLRASFGGIHFNAADNAIGACCRGDLNAVALRREIFYRLRQVNRARRERYAHGFDGLCRAEARDHENTQEKGSKKPTHETHFNSGPEQTNPRLFNRPHAHGLRPCRKFDW